MGSPLPPDPYLALSVAKDATAAAIKAQYRKLVLKFHPDKIQDEAQKQVASDQFHKIQTAYEIIGDDDKRQRYDAQCKLADLRRDVMEKGGGGGGRGPEVRTAAFKVPTEAPRAAQFQARGPERTEKVSPTYEERRPSYATDYFDAQPRPAARNSAEYEWETRRKATRDDRERTRTHAKEAERASRKEKSKRAERELRRERDRKQAYSEEDSSDSNSLLREADRMDGEEKQRAKDAYWEQARRQRDEAMQGVYDNDQRARKLFSQWDGATEYMSTRSVRRQESERRPSPTRKDSSKESKGEYVKRGEGRPTQIRRGSTRPKTNGHDAEPRRRDMEQRSSAEIVDEPHERRPATLNHSKSSPADIPPPYDKPRAQSVQIDEQDKEDFKPKVRRAETMPHPFSRERGRKEAAPHKSSGLRQTEFPEGLATPAATPEWTEGTTHKYRYGHQQQYADDIEVPTPDGYRTQIVEPVVGGAQRPSFARSPSPVRDSRGSREKTRASSARYAATSPQRSQIPHMPRTTSTSYVYPTSGQGVEHSTRAAPSRENSGRADGLLFGEVRTSNSPKPKHTRYSPPPEGVRHQREIRSEGVKMQSGYNYSRRPSDAARPTYSRSASGNPIYVR